MEGDVLIALEIDDESAESGKRTFMCPKSQLCDASAYFDRALNGEFKEASEGCLQLPGASVESVKLLLYYITQDEMPPIAREIAREVAKESGTTQEAFKERIVEYHKMLAEVWMLGEQVMMPEMQNEAMREILELMKQSSTPAAAVAHGFELGSTLKLGHVYAVEARYQYLQERTMSHSDIAQLAKVDGLIEAIFDEVRKILKGAKLKFKSANHECWDFNVDED